MSHLKTYRTLKNKCRNSKNKLPKVQKTTTAPAKNNCHRIRQLKFIMLCVSSSIKQRSKQHKTTAIGTKNNCQPTKKQLPSLLKTTTKQTPNNCRACTEQLPRKKKQLLSHLKTTAEIIKNNFREFGQLASWSLTYDLYRAAQNNCRGNKKHLPRQDKTTVKVTKNN